MAEHSEREVFFDDIVEPETLEGNIELRRQAMEELKITENTARDADEDVTYSEDVMAFISEDLTGKDMREIYASMMAIEKLTEEKKEKNKKANFSRLLDGLSGK